MMTLKNVVRLSAVMLFVFCSFLPVMSYSQCTTPTYPDTATRIGDTYFNTSADAVAPLYAAVPVSTRGNLTKHAVGVHFFDSEVGGVRRLRGATELRSIALPESFFSTYGFGFGTEIAVDAEKNIYFYSPWLSEDVEAGIYMINRNGTATRAISLISHSPTKMLVSGNKLYLLLFSGISNIGSIVSYNLPLESLPVEELTRDVIVSDAQPLGGFAVDRDGNVYYAFASPSRSVSIKKKAPSGSSVTVVGGGASREPSDSGDPLSIYFDYGQESTVKDLAVDQCGNLLIAAEFQRIYRLKVADNVLEILPDSLLPEDSTAVSIEVDHQNNIFVVADETPGGSDYRTYSLWRVAPITRRTIRSR